ncbi:MAG TPA: hypothetical protein VHG10_10930 [Glycomyces sp.]|nr:hypothetical protein [Glycomyces sp.]
MTNPPYAPGPPGDPYLPPQQPPGASMPPSAPVAPQGGPAAQWDGRSGSAAPKSGPGPQSFEYRPHDPYATFKAGQEAGPVLPPAPTFLQRWGFRGKDDRPIQVTVMLQTLWISLALTLLVTLIGAIAADSAVGRFAGLFFGVLVIAVCLTLIWAIAKEQLGRFKFQGPRKALYIGLGALGLNALIGFFSVWKFVPALAQAAAVLLCLVLIFTKPFRAWLRDRPGNQPRSDDDRRPGAHQTPLDGYQPPEPPQWRDTLQQPAAGPTAAPGSAGTTIPLNPPNPNSNPGWPQPPR